MISAHSKWRTGINFIFSEYEAQISTFFRKQAAEILLMIVMIMCKWCKSLRLISSPDVQLFLIPSAYRHLPPPVGVRHSNIICDSCKKHGIMGMRWKCKVCFDYDLCTHCYMNNKHDLSHTFERYETAHSQPWVYQASSLVSSHHFITLTNKLSPFCMAKLYAIPASSVTLFYFFSQHSLLLHNTWISLMPHVESIWKWWIKITIWKQLAQYLMVHMFYDAAFLHESNYSFAQHSLQISLLMMNKHTTKSWSIFMPIFVCQKHPVPEEYDLLLAQKKKKRLG